MPKLTETQREYMKAVGRGGVSIQRGYVHGAPTYITRLTHDACERRGWVSEKIESRDHWPVALTDAGRAALAKAGEAALSAPASDGSK